jgi:flagellar basal body-associated protein FliL
MADEPTPEQPPPAKPRRKWLGAVVTLVLIAVAAVGGTMFGPRLFGARQAGPEPSASALGSAEPEEGEEEEDSEMVPMAFAALIIDVRDRENAGHHMKVGLTAETPKGTTKEEFEKYSPRGREAAIVLLRSWKYEDLTDPAQFEKITSLLQERIIKAMGAARVKRVVITDYVAQ